MKALHIAEQQRRVPAAAAAAAARPLQLRGRHQPRARPRGEAAGLADHGQHAQERQAGGQERQRAHEQCQGRDQTGEFGLLLQAFTSNRIVWKK